MSHTHNWTVKIGSMDDLAFPQEYICECGETMSFAQAAAELARLQAGTVEEIGKALDGNDSYTYYDENGEGCTLIRNEYYKQLRTKLETAWAFIPVDFTHCKHNRVSVLMDFEIACEECGSNFELQDLIDGLRSVYFALKPAGGESA